ncbi:SUKH-4 family immunity protein [Streptomyces sp. NPDC059740]|uniref:SUKH-4 family immunity protein n=1 Tax=Streptomyces sp. NPDC059740 TaxID=3346926 RepID=UPI00365CFC10
MISQAQAEAIADRWLNPPDSQTPQRPVGMQEFDLGWVVWAVPPPAERDPQTGERRPPAEVGAACGVVDRASGELSVWPSVPVAEVARMYRDKHGAAPQASAGPATAATDGGTAPAGGTPGGAAVPHQQTGPAAGAPQTGTGGELPPVTGPGNTAVFTYRDPDTGEESTLARTSAPGLPPAEFQVLADIRERNVPLGDVVAVHTDLSPSRLPGGYPGEALPGLLPHAQFTCTQEYGTLAHERAEAVAGLLQHVTLLAQTTGQPQPPTPHRVPAPVRSEPASTVRDVALGRELTAAFGADAVLRHDADDVAPTKLPEAAKSTLIWAGLPLHIPFFFTADIAGQPPAGGLFTDAATHLRQVGTAAGDAVLEVLAGHVRIGSDGHAAITVQCTQPEHMTTPVGQVWAVPPQDAMGRRVNVSVSAFVRSLALLVASREAMRGADPYAAGAAVAAFQEGLVAIDPTALADPEDWWSVVVEQMWHGLF